jgi:hypothetical protein
MNVVARRRAEGLNVGCCRGGGVCALWGMGNGQCVAIATRKRIVCVFPQRQSLS